MDDRKKLYQLFVIVVMLVLLTGGILIGLVVSRNDDIRGENDNYVETEEVANKEVEIYKGSQDEDIEEDVEIVYVDIYKDCNHILENRSNEYGVKVQDIKKRELEKIEKEKSGYKLTQDTNGVLMFERTFDSKCANHYMLKFDNNGNVVILRCSEEGKYETYQETDINKESIRPDLAFRLEEGVEAETMEELYMFLEDLES